MCLSALNLALRRGRDHPWHPPLPLPRSFVELHTDSLLTRGRERNVQFCLKFFRGKNRKITCLGSFWQQGQQQIKTARKKQMLLVCSSCSPTETRARRQMGFMTPYPNYKRTFWERFFLYITRALLYELLILETTSGNSSSGLSRSLFLITPLPFAEKHPFVARQND